ncbi:molybdopterin-dependent oxidoreductase, partial [Adlercreutzia sp. DFI.6.23]
PQPRFSADRPRQGRPRPRRRRECAARTRRTEAAAIADVWLPVRPGTDAVLALGLLNVIIGEELYDASFVDAWCSGFDELARAVVPLAPEAVAVTCGV